MCYMLQCAPRELRFEYDYVKNRTSYDRSGGYCAYDAAFLEKCNYDYNSPDLNSVLKVGMCNRLL